MAFFHRVNPFCGRVLYQKCCKHHLISRCSITVTDHVNTFIDQEKLKFGMLLACFFISFWYLSLVLQRNVNVHNCANFQSCTWRNYLLPCKFKEKTRQWPGKVIQPIIIRLCVCRYQLMGVGRGRMGNCGVTLELCMCYSKTSFLCLYNNLIVILQKPASPSDGKYRTKTTFVILLFDSLWHCILNGYCQKFSILVCCTL